MADIQLQDNAIIVDAEVIGRALGIHKSLVQPLMREGRITSLSERGVEEDAGTYKVTFFYGSCRARLIVDEQGHILRRSTIDYGSRATPAMLRR